MRNILAAALLLAVEGTFATSVPWGCDVLAQRNASVLVDATDVPLRDSHGIPARLKDAGAGD